LLRSQGKGQMGKDLSRPVQGEEVDASGGGQSWSFINREKQFAKPAHGNLRVTGHSDGGEDRRWVGKEKRQFGAMVSGQAREIRTEPAFGGGTKSNFLGGGWVQKEDTEGKGEIPIPLREFRKGLWAASLVVAVTPL